MFADALEHLQAEMARLDLLLYRQILRLRAAYQLSLDEFRGLYISDEQVDSLINLVTGKEGSPPTTLDLTEQAEAMRTSHAEKWSDDLPWKHIIKEFNLSPFEQDVLLLALAPEIDLKYETLYAYLNNDITRKWPTCDLALRLFSNDASERMGLRSYLLPEATLFQSGLLRPVSMPPEHPSWLASGFSLASGVSQYILGFLFRDPRLSSLVKYRIPTAGWDEVPLSESLRVRLQQVVGLFRVTPSGKPSPMLVFEGRYGAGRGLAAEAICKDLGLLLLHVDIEAACTSSEGLQKIMQGLALQQRLQPMGIYLEHADALFDKEGHPLPEGYRVIRHLAQLKGPVFFVCTQGINWRELMRGQRYLAFHFGDPGYNERLQLWESYMAQQGSTISDPELEAIANRFILTPGQIKDAVLAAVESNIMKNGAAEALSLDTLSEAARAQSDQSLGSLAVKVNTIYSWDDLVLPSITLRQIKEIAGAIKYRHVVYSQWGFERRIASGKGLKVLFAGTSGTGKTMTAGVIARELGLDLYKIDLSGVVSKYIGETEKNLDRIFRASHSSNAILFFDEADALFGKRSEVKDAHDRYANIEVAYLLQKMEEHEGAVILASNLSKNIDDAFSRRMHYVVEFPLPDEALRERLWCGMFPVEVPLGEDVDFCFLAKQFPIAGGDIKNIALDAAFLAAQDGQMVTMKQLINAMARQMLKQGKIPSPTDFKHYHALIVQDR
jgi:ATP-dependent 26S proteasome regulatory subunit